jgi:hypothetical protein
MLYLFLVLRLSVISSLQNRAQEDNLACLSVVFVSWWSVSTSNEKSSTVRGFRFLLFVFRKRTIMSEEIENSGENERNIVNTFFLIVDLSPSGRKWPTSMVLVSAHKHYENLKV